MSFIGKYLLIRIDSRLRQAFPENANIPFGGRSIILVGDLKQLPHVMDKNPYALEGIAKELIVEHIHNSCDPRYSISTEWKKQ